MKRIKNYEDFVQEELDWKKAISGAALGASLAFGNPDVAHSQQPTQTEISIQQEVDFLQVVEVDSSMTKEQIQKLITTKLYSSPTVRMTSNTPGKIVCSVNFTSKPNYSNGRAYGTMEISFKDGKYKVTFKDIQFDYMGEQPTPPLQSAVQNVGRQVKNVATGVALSQIRNPLLQTVARQGISATNQRKPFVDNPNLTYQQAFSSDAEFTKGIDLEISNIMSDLNQSFNTGSDSDNNW